MIHDIEEQLNKYQIGTAEELEQIKSQQDVLKISYTINERKFLEKVEKIIHKEINNIGEDKEHEMIMKIWINELKSIISDVEKIKKMHPGEFILRMDEITNTIELYKQKFTK